MAKPPIGTELANPTVNRQILHQLMISNGRYNKRVLTAGESSAAGEYYGWIYFVTQTVFTAITDESILPATSKDSALVGLTYPAGSYLAGLFSDITVSSGDIVCYTNAEIEE